MLIIISIITRTINTNSVGPPTDSIIPLVSAIEGEREIQNYHIHYMTLLLLLPPIFGV